MKNKNKNYWPYYFGTLEWSKRILLKIYWKIQYIIHFRKYNRLKNAGVWDSLYQHYEDIGNDGR